LERIRAEEERKAAAARIDELERLVREERARQQQFQDRLMRGVYIGLALAGVLLVSRFLKRA
jgi:hypothetical protein